MPILKCLKSEKLLEFVSISKELSFLNRISTQLHILTCKKCKAKYEEIQSLWNSYLTPQPDITPSVLRVYSRLQADETLILKGWKLGEPPQQKSAWRDFIFKEGWIPRGVISIGMVAVFVFMMVARLGFNSRSEIVAQNSSISKSPLAQIRLQEKNRVKVHYLEPELLQTIEFETTQDSR